MAVNRTGHGFIHCEIVTRGSETEEKLWKKIEDKVKGKVCTDYWKAYEQFVHKEQHIQSKAETFTVGGYNSLFRHFLARISRTSKCYTKAKYMFMYFIELLMFKWNNKLATLF